MNLKKIAFGFILFAVVLISLFVFQHGFVVGALSLLCQGEYSDYSTIYHNDMLAYHEMVDGNVPDKTVIFIGDSLTRGLAVSAIEQKSENFGIGNDTSEGVAKRIGNYFSITKSKIVVITIGVNDLKNGKKITSILLNYSEIIDSIPDNVLVLFNAVFPVDEKCVNGGRVQNKDIDLLNDGIQYICNFYPRVYFLNINHLLRSYDGNLSPQYHSGDGVHLNSFGYSIWIRSLNRELTLINEIK